ncbi:MAG: response regulator [Candidatus Magnetomorum sp.]|nr:response regulator [Candidatus Magnetomorum sp.]
MKESQNLPPKNDFSDETYPSKKQSTSSEMISISFPRVHLTHELLTPLNAILGFTQILNSEKKQLSTSHKEAVQAIHQAGELLLNRITTLFQLNNAPVSVLDGIDMAQDTDDLPQNLHILIVDDAKTNRLVIKNMLSIFKGMTIDEAADGYSALEKIKINTPHMIFMDLYMPDLNGFDTARMIRKNSFYDNITIIAMSADACSCDENSLNDYGFNAFLEKPIRMSLMRSMIKEFSQNFEKCPLSESEMQSSTFSLKGLLPDQNILEKLIRFARQGAYSEIKHFLSQLENNHPEYAEFISQVQNFLKTFQFKNIIVLIKSNPLPEPLQPDETER